MTLILVPGLRGPAPDHWQEHLASRPDAVHLRTDREPLDLDTRVQDLDDAVAAADRPILIAHSAGVLTLLHWAAGALLSTTDRVVEALLVTPPTLGEELPPPYPRLAELSAHGWLPIPIGALPFAGTVCLSDDDPLGPVEEVRTLAAGWGAVVVELGAVGHANPASGLGPWPAMDTLVTATLEEYAGAGS
ncbi:MAG TPA: alpha/beta hydrolase [Intrasporangium sp.]|uniref:RBBP9/YdeN family alpha/beta hydrolase n=1 Tax=Intrasporangium sp. TaxID=1925024 RepID=UPI002D79155E|nr:alpha/beta hydrolase [Intrasporangium sp.]HET7397052.1 alpha/beta hydrolase [Intrasporangium sp.]